MLRKASGLGLYLLPVRSSSDAIAKYVGKYIAKHTDARIESDKGVRLVRYSKGARVGTTRFQFLSDGFRGDVDCSPIPIGH